MDGSRVGTTFATGIPRRDRPTPTTAKRGRPRKIGVGCPTIVAVRSRSRAPVSEPRANSCKLPPPSRAQISGVQPAGFGVRLVRVTTRSGTTHPSHEFRVQPRGTRPQRRRSWLNAETGDRGVRSLLCSNRFHKTSAMLLIVFTTVGVAAQEDPNFSGRWVLASTATIEHGYPVGAIRPTNARAHNGSL